MAFGNFGDYGGRDPYQAQPQQPRGAGAIVYPKRKTLGESYQDIQGLLPKWSPVTAERINTREVGGLNNVLGDDYFDLLEQQATKKLNERFFGAPDSLAKQQQQMFNKRGLIGSGIENQGQNQLYKTFGDELVNLQSDLAGKKIESQKDMAFRNKDIELSNARSVNEAAAANARMATDTAIKNRDFEGFLSELGLRGAADEAKTSTDFDTKMFESEVKQKGSELDYLSKDKESEREYMNNLTDQLLRSLGEENIDPKTRQYFESLFGSQIHASFPGAPSFDDFQADKKEKAAADANTPMQPPSSFGVQSNEETQVGADGRTYKRTKDRFGRWSNWYIA